VGAAASLVASLVGSVPLSAQVEVAEASILQLQEAMSAGRTTSVEITRAYLARIEQYDKGGPTLNAILRLNPDALAEAQAADAERARSGPRGPLHGIPIVVKDNYDVRGLPTSAGSIALANVMPVDDAFQVRRLREAGAVILGKSQMHELAGGITTRSSLGGQTRNPYDLTRNPGGSSGGTAVAVSASLAAVGWGTDACGSIRVPASQNNLVGLRVTKGLSSIDGILPLSHTQDVGGPIARSLKDLAVALDATVGHDPADPATRAVVGRTLPRFVDALDPGALRGARLGVLASFFGSGPEDERASRVVQTAVDEMVGLGAEIVRVEIPGLETWIERAVVMGDEFKWDFMDYLAGVPNAPVRSLTELLDLGLVDEELVGYLRQLDRPTERATPEYLTALAARDALRRTVTDLMDAERLDAIVYPTMLAIPAHVDDQQLGSNCRLSSTTGLPALTVPAGFTPQGLPIGLELLGRAFDDARLMALGYAYEHATAHRKPPPAAPPLVNGRAPAPLVFQVAANAEGWSGVPDNPAQVSVMFTLDLIRGTLAYEWEVRGVSADQVNALVLRSTDEVGTVSVLAHMAGPGETAGSGILTLNAATRARLEGGTVHLDLFTGPHPLGAARAPVRPPY
jgi:Asp-tRNA(Asn)/Glu-tRNA(Gln) amidotransferase A subunit family amidase